MTVGEVFKQRRAEKRRSIEEVSLRLKISAQKLQALENNEWERVPAWVYTRGYVAKYARYLGLDEKVCMAQCRSEYEVRNNATITLPRFKSPSFVITPTSAVLISIGVFLGSIGLYLIFNWVNFFAPPALVLEAPKDNSITVQGEIFIRGHAESGAKLTVNGAPVYPNDSGYFEVKRFLQIGLNIIEVQATNTIGKTSVQTRRVLYQQES